MSSRRPCAPQIHWAREVPNEKRDVIDIYLHDPRAEKYRKMDREKNGGHLPQRTILSNHICFCLVLPTYDQCADPLYTQLRANLPAWHALRSSWHKEANVCDESCACKKDWFLRSTKSEGDLHECLLCEPKDEPELRVEGDSGAPPRLYAPCCTRGECAQPGCLAARLTLWRACKTEHAESGALVRYRKYAKMPRTRGDGTEYFEVEFVYVEESPKAMTQTMLSAVETYLEHRRAHLYAVKQRELCIEKLKRAGPLAQLAASLGKTEAEAIDALRSCEHPKHLELTDHDIIIFTDFAARARAPSTAPRCQCRTQAPSPPAWDLPRLSPCARTTQVKYENASSSTCDHPNIGTICIAVVLHSPADRHVTKDMTESERQPTGLEDSAVSDPSKAAQTVTLGKRKQMVVVEKTLQCDVFAGYSEESGNARYDQTFQRDIVAFYKLGHFVHATAATSRGVPVPIGKDAASAKQSDYDTERLKREEAKSAAKKKEAEAKAAAASSASGSAVPAPAPSPAPAVAPKPKGREHKQRASAGKAKAIPVAATADDLVVTVVGTDRRGALTKMRIALKWSDGCGVQYVQREAALGTAAFYGDIEALARQAADAAARFGVIALHVVFEPHCFKYIHDAAGKVFVDYKNVGVMGRTETVSSIEEHYDFNAANMIAPKNENFNFDFSFRCAPRPAAAVAARRSYPPPHRAQQLRARALQGGRLHRADRRGRQRHQELALHRGRHDAARHARVRLLVPLAATRLLLPRHAVPARRLHGRADGAHGASAGAAGGGPRAGDELLRRHPARHAARVQGRARRRDLGRRAAVAIARRRPDPDRQGEVHRGRRRGRVRRAHHRHELGVRRG